MIAKYESEISKLREDLAEAYNVAQQETNKRQQMEEDLRRMFLKNMTNLNMEALSLFQTAYNAPSELDEDAAAVLTRQSSGKKASKAPQPKPSVAPSLASRQQQHHHAGASAKQAQEYVSSLQAAHVHSDVITSANLVGAPSYHGSQAELEKIRKLKELQLQQQYNQAGLSRYGPTPSSASLSSVGSKNHDDYDGEDQPRPALPTNGHSHSRPVHHSVGGSSTSHASPLMNPLASSLSAAYSGQLASTTKLANNVRNPPPTAVSRNVAVITTPLSSKGSPQSGAAAGGGHHHHSPPYGRK